MHRARILFTILFATACCCVASVSQSAEILVEENLTYGLAGETELKLDLARPDGDAPHPAIVFIHGGGWANGDRQRYRNSIKKAAKRGYVAVTISYRLMQFDKSKIYLVDDMGQPLFNPLDDQKLFDEQMKKADDLLNELASLRGRTIIPREVRQQEKPIDIPPGSKVEIVTSFHTPLRPKHLLLSILGVSVGKDLLELQPVRIIVPDDIQ